MSTTKSDNGGSVQRMVRRIHVLPVGDVELHAAQSICWCHPTETEPKLWVHNAKDCREARERATGEKCGDGWVNIAEYVPPNAESIHHHPNHEKQ